MKYVLCGRKNGCCPTIEDTEYGYTIKDDFGGEVKLTKAEFNLLKYEAF